MRLHLDNVRSPIRSMVGFRELEDNAPPKNVTQRAIHRRNIVLLLVSNRKLNRVQEILVYSHMPNAHPYKIIYALLRFMSPARAASESVSGVFVVVMGRINFEPCKRVDTCRWW